AVRVRPRAWPRRRLRRGLDEDPDGGLRGCRPGCGGVAAHARSLRDRRLGGLGVSARAEALLGPAPTELPRLLAGVRRGRPLTMTEHVELHGPLPRRRDLIEAATASGLGGRGGAGFPTGRKLAAVAAVRGRKRVLANGT